MGIGADCPNCDGGLGLGAAFGLPTSVRCARCGTVASRDPSINQAIWNAALTVGGSALILAYFTVGRPAAALVLVAVGVCTLLALWIGQLLQPYGRAD